MVDETRKNWIDAAKGYGMILVILAHIAEYTPVGLAIYSFHMPMFFFLSGYLLSVRGSFIDFAVRKTKRLLVPYFLYAIPLVLWDAIVIRGKNYWQYAPVFDGTKLISIDGFNGTFDWNTLGEQSEISILLRDMLGLIIQKRMWTHWFLACLIILCLLFYGLIVFIKKEYVRTVIVTMITIAGFCYYHLGGKPLIWNIDAVFVASSFFYAGYMAKKYNMVDGMLNLGKPAIIITVSASLTILFCSLNYLLSGYGLDMYNCEYGIVPIMYISAFSGTTFIISLSNLSNPAFIRFIGRHSIYYFIFHQGIFIPVIEKILNRLTIFQAKGSDGVIYDLLVLGLTCGCISLPIYLMEKGYHR